jgi:hypothetical protein
MLLSFKFCVYLCYHVSCIYLYHQTCTAVMCMSLQGVMNITIQRHDYIIIICPFYSYVSRHTVCPVSVTYIMYVRCVHCCCVFI